MMKCYICSHASCRVRIQEQGYCDKHKQDEANRFQQYKQNDREGMNWHNLYNNNRWRNARSIFLRNNPLCVMCGQPATVVDHSIPHRGNEEIFWDQSQLQSLCSSCHGIKTCQEDLERRRDRREGQQPN